MTINVIPVPAERLAMAVSEGTAEDSASVRSRVCQAREVQLARFANADTTLTANSQMSAQDIRLYCRVSPEAERILMSGGKKHSLTSRGLLRSLKVARTIADMEGQSDVLAHHIAEALQFRKPAR